MMLLSKERHRQHRSKYLPDMFKSSLSGTLSPETTATTSSGYSTGGSSVSTCQNPSLKKLLTSSLSSSATSTTRKEHYQQQKQAKTKSKGLINLFIKLKNLLLPSRNKPMRSTTSREISSTNRLGQYRQPSPIYDVLPSSSSLIINNGISLPFTYYSNSPIRQSRTNFEKISAWLDHTDRLKYGSNEFLFIEARPQLSTSSREIDNQGITFVTKKTPMNIQPPKRSSSLVARITRPILEQNAQKLLSPSASFSSSILARGMSERMTPPHPAESRLSKSNRRRPIDFSRRRTIDGTNEHRANKENISNKNQDKSSDDIYRFPSHSNNKKVEILLPSSKQITTKKYFFHSHPMKSNEDLLNNSYGLALLNQQPRHSTATTVLTMSQVPSQISSTKQQQQEQHQSYVPRKSYSQPTRAHQTFESLDDLLCDREVESYFYPTSSSHSEHVYMNVENPSSSLSSIHGTLC